MRQRVSLLRDLQRNRVLCIINLRLSQAAHTCFKNVLQTFLHNVFYNAFGNVSHCWKYPFRKRVSLKKKMFLLHKHLKTILETFIKMFLTVWKRKNICFTNSMVLKSFLLKRFLLVLYNFEIIYTFKKHMPNEYVLPGLLWVSRLYSRCIRSNHLFILYSRSMRTSTYLNRLPLIGCIFTRIDKVVVKIFAIFAPKMCVELLSSFSVFIYIYI